MEKLRQMEVYSYAPWSRIPPDTRVLGTTWVDESKGSRLCVQEFATTRRTDLFSATPPLCLTRVLISRCATATRGGGGGRQLMALDVRRAFLHGVVERELSVRPPPEDTYASSHGVVWKLEKSLYGTRDAPQLWRKQVVATMLEAGFQMCKVSPCLFFHDQRDLMVIVHVGGFLACGSKADLVWFRTAVERKYEIKSEILGHKVDEEPEISFLKRQIRVTEAGLEYEADGRHVVEPLRKMDMGTCKPVVSPGSRDEERNSEDKHLDPEMATLYKSGAAVINYLAGDRPDVGFAGKEVCRWISAPTLGDWVRLKRILRYLKGQPRVVWQYRWQEATNQLKVFTDSDWAGCRRSRKSTSGGMAFIGEHMVLHWSRTQAVIALSSGEAEMYSALKGAAEGLFLKNAMEEVGEPVDLTLLGDSSACQGMLDREGVGAVKHLATKQLWLQERMAKKEMVFKKVPRLQNPADALTHHWDGSNLAHFRTMGLVSGG